LNTQQQDAVTLGWGPSLVVAGAGSGKTTVLTRRVAWLLSELHQPPWSVMAVTFTNKAAAEMKLRVESLLGEGVAKRLTVGTFHSICARILRREIHAYESAEGFKWKSNFVIYDETDSLNVVKGVVSKLNLDEKVFAPKEMRHSISGLKNDGLTAHQYSQEARNYRDTRLSEIFTNYQSELARNNALDFDDLIAVFNDLLERNEEVRRRVHDQYRHLLVDEFQDTNKSQYRFIRLLSFDENPKDETMRRQRWENRSLMVVGDVDQSIYSWRKADFRIILGFQNDFKEAAVVKLEENYRSTATILEVANSIIINNSERLEKTLRCNRGEGGKVRCYGASDEIDEAFFVVDELKRLGARSLRLSDCCVLYRTNAQSRAIEEVLVRSGVPYTMVGGTRFYDRAEIKDVIAYMKLVYNPDDGVAFQRVVNNPRRGLGKTTLERVAEYAVQNNLSQIDAAAQATRISDVSPKAAKTLIDFANSVRRWQTTSNVMSVARLLELVLKESTYLATLEKEAAESKDEVVIGRIDNVRELVVVAQEFEQAADEPTLEAFLTRISLVSDLDSADMNQDSIKLMTLHSAKGLEFPTVFMLGLEDGLFPHIRSHNSPSAMEEERRLMYVGVTRAEDRLYLTYSRRRSTYGETSYTIPSRFLSEIKSDCLQGFQPDPESAFRAESQERGRPARSGYEEYSEERHGRLGGSGNTAGEQKPKPRVLARRPGAEAAEEQSSVKPAANFERLRIGDNVMHAKFGIGKVSQVIGEGDKELYNVEFQTAGKRLLDPRFAKLVKLD
jgi:DNA helicase-2/ATP-dependent DNA helicase PcrA